MNFCLSILCSKQIFCLSLLMSPHRKEMGETVFWFFLQRLEEMHQELSKYGEDHKLGDVKTTPLYQHTLGLHTFNFCFSINALYHINLEHLLFAYVIFVWFVFVLIPTLSFIYERASGSLGWIKLYAIKKIRKGMFELIQKDIYSCMIYVIF